MKLDAHVHTRYSGRTSLYRRRHDVASLLPYLKEAGVFTVLNHVASRVNGRVTAAHVAALVPWIDAFEVRNGSRLAVQNRTAEALAGATGLALLHDGVRHPPVARPSTRRPPPAARLLPDEVSA